MSLKHKGVRPTYHVELMDYKKQLYIEICPDGRRPVWNNRMLTSGCGGLITKVVEWNGLVYCPWCKEYFSRNQWVSDAD